jgi:uncharacterized protein
MLDLIIDALPYVAIGFVAQMFDGAIGMGFGAISYAVLTLMGYPKEVVSASVNGAKMFTGAISGASHVWHKNVDWKLFRTLALAGAIGGLAGALLLAHGPVKWISPAISIYLIGVGGFIIYKAYRPTAREPTAKQTFAIGGFGGILEALAGVWGPLVTSNLVALGSKPRYTVGSANLAEFVVAVVVFAILVHHLGTESLTQSILGLFAGAILAAPIAARFTRQLPTRTLMIAVGCLVISVSLLRLWRLFTGN